MTLIKFKKFSKLDYCQYLLSSQINYTITNLADHIESLSHDSINRYLRREKLTPNYLWDNVKKIRIINENGYLIFDVSVLDKRYATKIELTSSQYSGNEKKVIRGIGIVNCIYVNPETKQFWIIDYRLYDPDGDGKSKLDHVNDMLLNAIAHKQLPFRTVLMDSWYATRKLMLLIEKLGKYYYCPLKRNRLVDDSGGLDKYKQIAKLDWNPAEQENGKNLKIKAFPKNKKVKLFRVFVSTDKTEYVATNDVTQNSTDAVQDVCGIRWLLEEFHREIKQLTGIEAMPLSQSSYPTKSH